MCSGSHCSFHMLTMEAQFTHKGMSYIDVPLFIFVGIVLFSTHWMGRPTLIVVSPSEWYIYHHIVAYFLMSLVFYAIR